MRDNQKSRVYAAEAAALDVFGSTMTTEELQAEADRITDLRGIRGRWGLREVRVVASNGRGGSTNGFRIRLGSSARTTAYLCHEIAHCLTPNRYADHGPEFAGVLLHVVRQAMGKEAADALRASFKERGVRYRLTAIPKGLSPMPAPRAQQRKQADAERRERCVRDIQRMIRKGWITAAQARHAVEAA